MGTDVAIETADVALMGDHLRHLAEAFSHARRAGAIMRQNLLLSETLAVLVPPAAAGVLSLATVVAIHELAEVVVMPALRFRCPPPSASRRVARVS